MIRDRIVCGAKDNAVRRKLLQESGLTLKKCIDMCRAAEATAAQLKVMAANQDPVKEINFVKKKRENKPTAHKASGKSLPSQLVADCKFCGRQHEKKRNAPHSAKPAPRVVKTIISRQSVKRRKRGGPKERPLVERKSTRSMTTTHPKRRSCQ